VFLAGRFVSIHGRQLFDVGDGQRERAGGDPITAPIRGEKRAPDCRKYQGEGRFCVARVADFTMRFLRDVGVSHVFMVSGGGIMHLTDALGLCEGLHYVCNHNEAACATAAEGYARLSGRPGALLVTTGPGSTNALASLPGAFVDSIPVIVISGQVRSDIIADYARQRQNGPQEINILDMVKPVTKYAVTVLDPKRIRAELEIAYAHAVTGRPGPVWVNLPLDVQGAEVDDEQLVGAGPDELPVPPAAPRAEQIDAVVAGLRAARRPVLIAGNGIRLAGAVAGLERLCELIAVPVVLTIGAMDLLAETNPNYVGKLGPFGQRRANFVLQNADLVLSVGASMNISSIGFAGDFAPRAHRIMVNVDRSELDKANYRPDLAIQADAGEFLDDLIEGLSVSLLGPTPVWHDAIENWRRRYPPIEDAHREDPEYVNSYLLVDALSDVLNASDVVVTGNSLDAVSVYQAYRVKPAQRVFTNVNYGAMGWDLPAAVGVACAAGGRRVVLVTGDGSIQFNLQELMTISVNRLNVAILVLNNDGYQSIRTTQSNYFESRFVGASFGSGIGNPDFATLAAAYRIPYHRADRQSEVAGVLREALAHPGPVFCEFRLSPVQARIPRSSSFRRPDGSLESKPLHDMFPFLPAAEIAENMSIFDEPVRSAAEMAGNP
jgi:acetolactate synthase-1/2/3 large subunit